MVAELLTSKTVLINPLDIIISQKSEDNIFYNLRQTFDKVTMEELRNSIAANGLQSQLTVRLMPNESIELLAGERRLRSILRLINDEAEVFDRETGLKGPASKVFSRIPAVMYVNCDDRQALKISAIENLDREQVNIIDLMTFCIDLLEKKQDGKNLFSIQDVAAIIGKSPQWIYQTRRLMNLPIEAKKMIMNGSVDRNLGLSLLKVKEDKIPEVIEQAVVLATQEHAKIQQVAKEEVKIAAQKLEEVDTNSVVAEYLGHDLQDFKKARSVALQRLKESKNRRDSANEKKPKLSPEHIEKSAMKMEALEGKNAPASTKAIRIQREELDSKFKAGELKEFDEQDVELVLTVCDGILGEFGEFNLVELLKTVYKKWSL